MPKSTKTSKKIEDIEDFSEMETSNVGNGDSSVEVQETPKAPEKKPPVVEAGDYFRHAKIRANGLICAPYGTFNAGDTGTIPYRDAVEMQKDGRCTILED